MNYKEEAIEEKPVRKINWMAGGSLCLGILSLLLSPWVMGWIESFFNISLVNWWALTAWGVIIIPLVIALTGLVLGINSSRQAKGRNRLARAGILINAFGLALLLLTSCMTLWIRAGGTIL